MLLCEGGERRTEHREVQCRHFLIEQFSARSRHQSCKPWFHSNTSTDQAARNSWPEGRRNVKTITDCRCRNSLSQGRRSFLRDKEPKPQNIDATDTSSTAAHSPEVTHT